MANKSTNFFNGFIGGAKRHNLKKNLTGGFQVNKGSGMIREQA